MIDEPAVGQHIVQFYCQIYIVCVIYLSVTAGIDK